MYTFADYKLRAAKESDREMCAAWIEKDDDHRGRCTPDFFIQPEAGIECFVLEDKNGTAQFFFRISRALRLDIQFSPASSKEEKEQLATALMHGFTWLQGRAQRAGFRQVIFASTVAPLIRFCNRRFGFQKSPDELVCSIPALDVHQAGKQ